MSIFTDASYYGPNRALQGFASPEIYTGILQFPLATNNTISSYVCMTDFSQTFFYITSPHPRGVDENAQCPRRGQI